MKKLLQFFAYYILIMFMPILAYFLTGYISVNNYSTFQDLEMYFLALGILLLLPHILFVWSMYYALQGWVLVYKAKNISNAASISLVKEKLIEYLSSVNLESEKLLIEQMDNKLIISFSNKNHEDSSFEQKRYVINLDESLHTGYGTSQIVKTLKGQTSISVSKSSGIHYAFGSEIKQSYKIDGDEVIFVPENFSYSITDIVDPVRIILLNCNWNFKMTTSASGSVVLKRNLLFSLSVVSLAIVIIVFINNTEAVKSFLTDDFNR